jgi:hypothetical protein
MLFIENTLAFCQQLMLSPCKMNKHMQCLAVHGYTLYAHATISMTTNAL